MGWEGANVIFDDWVHPLMMGLEEHLIGMFRHDFEFIDGHQSHLGHLGGHQSQNDKNLQASNLEQTKSDLTEENPIWTPEGQEELSKIPFFVRGKIRTKTEKYARQIGCRKIDGETLYEAKAHFKA